MCLHEGCAESCWDAPRRVRVHGFDLNDTLILTPSGKFPPVDTNDYQWLPGRLARIVEILGSHSRNVVWVLTNQGWKADAALQTATTIAERCLADIIAAYSKAYEGDVSRRVRLTIADKHHPDLRKPYPVAWHELRDELSERMCTPKLMYYCGDDMSRTGADILFAANAGAPYLSDVNYNKPELAVDPRECASIQRMLHTRRELGGDPNEYERAIRKIAKKITRKTLIIMMGLPGSGKSWLSRRIQEAVNPEINFHVYDEFTKEGEIYEGGLPCVYDRTHTTLKSYQATVAKIQARTKISPKIILVFVDTHPEICRMNLWARINQRVPEVALRVAVKKLEENRRHPKLAPDYVVTPPTVETWLGPKI